MPTLPAARLADAAARRDARRFCGLVLPAVSRTFAIGIRALPGDLGRAVLTSYLICRLADTVEDAPGMTPAEKGPLFDALLACFDGPEAAARFPLMAAAVTGDPAHLALVRHADLVFAHFLGLPNGTQLVVRRWVTEMVTGMRKFVELYPGGIRIQTLEEFREYCYYVAGTVGYLLTDLWREHVPAVGPALYARLRERARAFGEALQTVNILKDVAHDARVENSIYVPEELLRAHGSGHAQILAAERVPESRRALGRLVELAWADLEEASRYLVLLPRRAAPVRLFCALPLLYAYATLRDLAGSSAMLRPGGAVKISRREVKALLAAAVVTAGSNALVRRLVARVRRRPFVFGTLPAAAPTALLAALLLLAPGALRAQPAAPAVPLPNAPAPAPAVARGPFDVTLAPQADAGAPELLGRMTIDKRFHGDLEATSQGQMLSAMTATKGSAGYVAVERVTGTLAGRRGSFVLQHSGTMDRGSPSLAIAVVPDSGTDELAGLTGSMAIDVAPGGKHSYVFTYTLPPR